MQIRNLEAEKSILGSIVAGIYQADEAVDELTEADFSASKHQQIFRIIQRITKDGNPVDNITVSDHLNDSDYITSLISSIVPEGRNDHIRKLKEATLRRGVYELGQEAISLSQNKAHTSAMLLDDLEGQFFRLTAQAGGEDVRHVRDGMDNVFEEIRKAKDHTVTGVPTGFHPLDQVLAGFQRSNLIILAARPRMGKTALAGKFLVEASVHHQIPSLFFSLEMSRMQIVKRLLSSVSGVEHDKIRTGKLTDQEWRKLERAGGILSKAPLYIDDTPGISVMEMRSKARKMKRKHDIGFIVQDYLTLLKPGSRGQNRDQEVTDIAENLKSLAKELDLPILSLAQLNRECEKRNNKRPILSDLRESGGIEQAADDILMLYRDEVYNTKPDNPKKGIAEIIVRKQRNGPEGVVEVVSLLETMNFGELAR